MALSPMMQQYLQTKDKYKDCILLYRLGDFYEMFFDDAIEISRVLGLTLTGRDCGLGERAPMCGIPYHALDAYMLKLLERDYKVAICEQLTQPDKKGIVERDVVRVVTPGTVMEESLLDESKYNYIASVVLEDKMIGICWADITTGDLYATQVKDSQEFKEMQDILTRIMPAEIISNSKMVELSKNIPSVKHKFLPGFTAYNDWVFSLSNAEKFTKEKLSVVNLDVYGLKDKNAAIQAVGGLLYYLQETQKRTLSHINKVMYRENASYMVLDMNTRRNLELCYTLQDRKKYGSLLWLLDSTKTCMGARNLRAWLEQPLQEKAEIDLRLDSITEIKANLILQNDLSEALSNIRDIERLTGKIAYNSVTPKDVEMLSKSLKTFPVVVATLLSCSSELISMQVNALSGLDILTSLIDSAIVEGATANVKDGGFIKHGYNKELDSYIEICQNGKKWISTLESTEKEKTGIKNLKIGYNKIFGYFIEITKSYQEMIPYYYTRKQTLANCERYVTDELKEMEDKILNASENLLRLELSLFVEIRNYLMDFTEKLQQSSKAVGIIDTLLSLAKVACKYNYVRPQVVKGGSLDIKEGRHPVVEALLKNEQFISNDTYIDDKKSRAMLITGPNMAGKSTYMRQVALICLMAHIGSFVPAYEAKIPIIDKIFTRVGASDNLAFSQSTFMVEMSEVANILNNATNDSLIILDEVGRGTSTYDGMSIAWAVMEYLLGKTTAKVLFATHYHELTELESRIEGVKNYQVMIKELSDSIIFLRKIIRGGADKSFGIEVAKLAGLPKDVIVKAKEIMENLHSENGGRSMNSNVYLESLTASQIEVINIIKDINVNNVTPLIAFDTLLSLKNKVEN